MSDLERRVEQAVARELDRDFEAWLARWCSPAGMFADAPEPPTRYKTSPAKIGRAALKAHAEWLEEQGLVVVPKSVLDAAVKRANYDYQEGFVQVDPNHFHMERREAIFELRKQTDPYNASVGFAAAQ